MLPVTTQADHALLPYCHSAVNATLSLLYFYCTYGQWYNPHYFLFSLRIKEVQSAVSDHNVSGHRAPWTLRKLACNSWKLYTIHFKFQLNCSLRDGETVNSSSSLVRLCKCKECQVLYSAFGHRLLSWRLDWGTLLHFGGLSQQHAKSQPGHSTDAVRKPLFVQ